MTASRIADSEFCESCQQIIEPEEGFGNSPSLQLVSEVGQSWGLCLQTPHCG